MRAERPRPRKRSSPRTSSAAPARGSARSRCSARVRACSCTRSRDRNRDRPPPSATFGTAAFDVPRGRTARRPAQGPPAGRVAVLGAGPAGPRLRRRARRARLPRSPFTTSAREVGGLVALRDRPVPPAARPAAPGGRPCCSRARRHASSSRIAAVDSPPGADASSKLHARRGLPRRRHGRRRGRLHYPGDELDGVWESLPFIEALKTGRAAGRRPHASPWSAAATPQSTSRSSRSGSAPSA